MPISPTIDIPPKDRFSLPEVLKLLKPLGCVRDDLFEYLRSGRLRTVCFPYRFEPDREIPIEPGQFERVWKDAWHFPVYNGWIGNEDYGGVGESIPLHMVPDAVDADTKRKLADGIPAAQSAVVYVQRDELIQFIKWLQNPRRSRRGTRRPGAGRPVKHDYSKIDSVLEAIFREHGKSGFNPPGQVMAVLREELGEGSLPHPSTVYGHVKSWLKTRLAASR